MTSQQKPAKAMNIILWIAQVLLAASFAFGGIMKLFQPIEALTAMWPWTGQIPIAFVKLTGTFDLLGAIGLILPALLRIKSNLTVVAAICCTLLMVCASVFHLVRGEGSQIGANIVFAILAVFIAWGRSKKAPIASR